ncbi:IS5 family transposase [Acinetobacter sp. TTH0-4]|uniref:IS5 family transposase n=1 Tax=Acinetobacter sp. TTH0-4 TaxID=1646498 RepID=UPI00189E9F3F|nr:IS5 family transposase [Acinetobacter sp. TTH0-4]QPF38712.1 IS5 family transposase [Acinetobacter sp. TTH0-4]
MKYQKLNRFSDSEFQRLVGVPRAVFSEMVEVLKEAESLKKKPGRPHTLDIEDQLLLTLNYLWNYSTQLELAANYHIAESNVNRTIKKVEDALMKSRRFTLPKRSITTADEQFNWVIIDATECSIERPKKNQSKFYSGKKKKHTLKAQVIYHPNSKQIIGLDISNGSQHDIKLARKTVKKFKHCEYVMTDLGYYGLEQDGFKLLMPIKKKKNLPLFDIEKKYNKMIGKIRVVIEHINSQLKTFRILSERYRNRRKRFGLRINLIAALVNRINLQ